MNKIPMNEKMKAIQAIEQEIEEALWAFEVQNEIEKAYEVYLEAEHNLNALAITTEDTAYPEHHRVLAYCLLRQGNILRQLGKPKEALTISERELVAARAANDEVMLARSLMSNGTNYIVAGEVEKGLVLLNEAREIFSGGESYDHHQGLGWYWILQADLTNAGLINNNPEEVLEIANRALKILAPIENWPGVARAYAARVKVHQLLGDETAAAVDLERQAFYQKKTEAE